MVYTHSMIIKPKQKYTYSCNGNPAQSLVKGHQITVLHHSLAVLYHRQPATQHKELCSSTSFLRFAYDFSFGFICSNRRKFRLYSTAGSVLSKNSCAVVPVASVVTPDSLANVPRRPRPLPLSYLYRLHPENSFCRQPIANRQDLQR